MGGECLREEEGDGDLCAGSSSFPPSASAPGQGPEQPRAPPASEAAGSAGLPCAGEPGRRERQR